MSLSVPRALARLRTTRAFTTTCRSSSEDPTTKKEKFLYGTAPSHRSYIFIHASEPPSSFPARLSTPLQRALQLKVMKWGGTINFSWLGPPKSTGGGPALTAFSTLGGRLEVPELNMDNMDEVAEVLERHATEGPLASGTSDEVHLYVCTHGARDCRCGEMGGAVLRALQGEVARLAKADPLGIASRIKIGEVGHVGGHQYAANLLIYPHGEWLGMLKPEDVPIVLARVLDSPVRPYTSEDAPIVPSHWRGRMGFAKDDQAQLFQSLYPNSLL
ncbi:Altered inheritance of mitochondria protein 32, partial [Termitomyces sp. T112]